MYSCIFSCRAGLMITEGSHFLWRFHYGGGAYQPVCEIMGLDSSESWPLVVTLFEGSNTIRGPAAESEHSCALFRSSH